MKFKTKKKRKSPGYPLLRTLCFTSEGPGSSPDGGIKNPSSRAAKKKKKKLVKLAEFKHEVAMARWRARESEAATPSSQLSSMELTMWD